MTSMKRATKILELIFSGVAQRSNCGLGFDVSVEKWKENVGDLPASPDDGVVSDADSPRWSHIQIESLSVPGIGCLYARCDKESTTVSIGFSGHEKHTEM